MAGNLIAQEVETRNYGADDRLRVLQKYDVRRSGDWGHKDAGVWEEYRYDPLGRRVLVRTRADGGICNVDPWTCTSSTTIFVWSGDQLLWELKSATGTLAGAAGGSVHYFHAGGIDRPLVITKGSLSVIPHQNRRGQFARGTYASGTSAGMLSDCPAGQTTSCVQIPWPGERTTARHEIKSSAGRIQNWFGGLVDGMRDASGQMYMRNRYYDPATGQFTQTDPIGLAGGLNAYGFAAGDPVSYDDPYGLCAWGIGRDAALGNCSATDNYHTRGLTSDRWAEYSSCRMLGCRLRPARPDERDYVMGRLSSLRTDLSFCRIVAEQGFGMAARQLGMFDNDVRTWEGGRLYGNAPMHERLGGVVMYLSSRLYKRNGGLAVVHEAVHGVLNPRRAIQPTYYSDHGLTELGLNVDDSALVCMGALPYP